MLLFCDILLLISQLYITWLQWSEFLSCFSPLDDVIQFTAITWLREFIILSGRTMLPFNAGILKAILPCMAYEQDKQNIL